VKEHKVVVFTIFCSIEALQEFNTRLSLKERTDFHIYALTFQDKLIEFKNFRFADPDFAIDSETALTLNLETCNAAFFAY